MDDSADSSNGTGTSRFDVVVVGGGPAGSTLGTLIRKYNPQLSVLIIEKAKFPREHIGESHLPAISGILYEMGVWDKVEAANFPIKIGASYTWGQNRDQWDFDFYPVEKWKDEPRPAKFRGQRQYTAFQVERSIYDDILLRHAESLGCAVREETTVREALIERDRINGLKLDTGEVVTGTHYVDASGAWAFLRKQLGVETKVTQELRNIAMWDYWENAEWAVEIGVGATRVFIRSLPYGWIWFIPMGPTRTSIGFICPHDYFSEQGKSKEDMYRQALADDQDISRLIANATPRGEVEACKDWSHIADQLVGENWFLIGEAAGFADPILAAGMTLAQSAARDCAYTILELERGRYDAAWLRDRFNTQNRTNIEQHIRFAEFWYAANGCFSDISEHCRNIARDAGLNLTPTEAWRWLSQGGLENQTLQTPTVGTFDLSSAKRMISQFDSRGREVERFTDGGYNVFDLNLDGAEKVRIGNLAQGEIQQVPCLERDGKRLPLTGHYQAVLMVLKTERDLERILGALRMGWQKLRPNDEAFVNLNVAGCIQALEYMTEQGWVKKSKDPSKRTYQFGKGKGSIRLVEETRKALKSTPDAPDVKYNI